MKRRRLKFKEGDVVVHVTGNRKMIVTEANPHEDDILIAMYDCKWESGEDFNYGMFFQYELKRAVTKSNKK